MVNFENLPNKTTPLHKTNMNKIQTDLQSQLTEIQNGKPLIKKGQITSDTNWDTITAPGYYVYNAYLGNETGNNRPTTTKFLGQVLVLYNEESENCTQIVFYYKCIYIRLFMNNTWREWHSFYAEGDLPTSRVEATYNSKITTVDMNRVSRYGKVTSISFRGYVNTAISDDSIVLSGLPTNRNGVGQISGIYYGAHYDYEKAVFGYIDDNGNLKIRTSNIPAGKYLHINITYITYDV